MTDLTKIEWTDFTVNFWEGCQKVGPGCDHCYAEARDTRFTGGKHWGPGAPRRKVKGGIAKLRKINRDAEAFHAAHGRWPRVFCSSLSDVFDNAVDPEWRREAFAEIEAAENTRIQMLTKRISNVLKMVPATWLQDGWPSHVGLMITVVNQEEANRDVPKLLDLSARFGIPWVGLSMEPLLGPVDLTSIPDPSGLEHSYMDALRGKFWMPPEQVYWPTQSRPINGRLDVNLCGWVDWIIVGGESGHSARPMHPDWARSLRDQCEAAGVPFLFKQWGEWHSDALLYTDMRGNCPPPNMKVGKKKSGRLLDGREWNEVPA
ncbi:gp38 [Ruegeria sp. TrichCH4B]|nr:gp38 [Ruegeria sp. TrichCH4B]